MLNIILSFPAAAIPTSISRRTLWLSSWTRSEACKNSALPKRNKSSPLDPQLPTILCSGEGRQQGGLVQQLFPQFLCAAWKEVRTPASQTRTAGQQGLFASRIFFLLFCGFEVCSYYLSYLSLYIYMLYICVCVVWYSDITMFFLTGTGSCRNMDAVLYCVQSFEIDHAMMFSVLQ